MSEKHLTELAWKNIAKEHKVTDTTLSKALAKFLGIKQDSHDELLKALGEVENCSEKLRVKEKDKGEVVEYLKEVEKETKVKALAIWVLKKGAKGKSEEEESQKIEEQEAQEFLKDVGGNVKTALTKVKSLAPEKPLELDGQMKFMAYVAGKKNAVIVSKNVGGATKKILRQIAGVQGGAYLEGLCIFEDGAHTFVLAGASKGMASKFSKGLHAETGIKYKVRVRDFLNQNISDSDAEDSEPDEDPVVAFKQRMAPMVDRMKEASSIDPEQAEEIRLRAARATDFAKQGKFELADKVLDSLDELLKKVQDAHGNVREIADKEDRIVKNIIKNLPKNALTFQTGKFGSRMSRVSGMGDVSWDSLIGKKEGGKERSNAFDVISQTNVFNKDELTPNSENITYLTFQDSMYDNEPGSRRKLVLALYEKKKKALAGNSDALKTLEEHVQAMNDTWGDKNATFKAKTEAINKAFTAMGMKGVSPELQKVRDDIKERAFLGKDNEVFSRGRVGRTPADAVLGFASKAQTKLAEDTSEEGKKKAEEFTKLVEAIKKLRIGLELVQKKITGLSGKDLDPSAKEELGELQKQEKKILDGIGKYATPAAKIMEELKIVAGDKAWEIGGGIGSNDGAGGREVYEAENDVFMGKNVNVRDDSSAASGVFRELGIPFTGGASGSTVDAVGGIVDSLLKENEDVNAPLDEKDPRLATAEAEICMYILGMHTAGHHSLVEMLYAAKQYPQKFFRKLRDPITDYLKFQEASSEFLKKPLTDFQNPKGQEQLDEKALAAKRYEAMTKECKQDVISHAECVGALIKYCNAVVGKV